MKSKILFILLLVVFICLLKRKSEMDTTRIIKVKKENNSAGEYTHNRRRRKMVLSPVPIGETFDGYVPRPYAEVQKTLDEATKRTLEHFGIEINNNLYK